MILVILGCVLLGVAVLWDVIGMSVVGFPKSDDEILKVLERVRNNQPEEYIDGDLKTRISPLYKAKILNVTMISTFKQPFMSKTLPGMFFKWYVDGYGVVPRWYKSHSEIEKLYNELKKEKLC